MLTISINLTSCIGYACRADKNPYRHDRRADKNPYRHDRRADSQCPKTITVSKMHILLLYLKCILH